MTRVSLVYRSVIARAALICELELSAKRFKAFLLASLVGLFCASCAYTDSVRPTAMRDKFEFVVKYSAIVRAQEIDKVAQASFDEFAKSHSYDRFVVLRAYDNIWTNTKIYEVDFTPAASSMASGSSSLYDVPSLEKPTLLGDHTPRMALAEAGPAITSEEVRIHKATGENEGPDIEPTSNEIFIHGFVSDKHSGRVISNATVWYGTLFGHTDAAGAYSIQGTPGDRAILVAKAPGYVDNYSTLDPVIGTKCLRDVKMTAEANSLVYVPARVAENDPVTLPARVAGFDVLRATIKRPRNNMVRTAFGTYIHNVEALVEVAISNPGSTPEVVPEFEIVDGINRYEPALESWQLADGYSNYERINPNETKTIRLVFRGPTYGDLKLSSSTTGMIRVEWIQ